VATLALRTPSRTELASRRGPLTADLLPALLAEAGADVDVLALPVAPGPSGPDAGGPGAVLAGGRGLAGVVGRYGVEVAAVVAAEKVRGRTGEVVRVPVLAPDGLPARLLLVGIGPGTPADLRRAAAALSRAVRGKKHLVTTLGDGVNAEGARAVVEGLLLGGYTAPSAGLKPREDSGAVARATLVGNHAGTAIAQGVATAGATTLARDLAETPSNLKNPGWLAERARTLATAAGLDVQVWDVARLEQEGFGGVLAVGSGSATPPRFVRIDYRPADPRAAARRPIVLVGKGITYDTGGISIKPRESMVPMKTDMSGAAAVLATVLAAPALELRRPVTALLPIAENAFGASSYRPSDVVTVRGGTTVEILNTDAEGRMVLADALSYAHDALDPEIVVDVATLTGAATLGLGKRHAAMYATDDRLAAGLIEAGELSGEHLWRMPLVEDYRFAIDSPIADLRHVPGPKAAVGGGSITAALFLREFTGGRRWAHLDIAGPARSDREEYEVNRGATGFGARVLLRWLESLR
jgi:leucyl aminopeptidase